MTNTDNFNMDEIGLCKGCDTSKHLNPGGLCGRCVKADNPRGLLIEAVARYREDKQLNSLGKEMFRFKSELGFPPDMFLDELAKRQGLDRLQKIYVLNVYFEQLIEHKRLSAAQEKALERTRRHNKEHIVTFIKTGEVGVY